MQTVAHYYHTLASLEAKQQVSKNGQQNKYIQMNPTALKKKSWKAAQAGGGNKS